MPSITSWSRIEPISPEGDDRDALAGLTACTADALWFLARQWQMGEFQAEDGGSPIVARWRGHVAKPTRFKFGPIPPNTRSTAPRFEDHGVPLEVFVERQPHALTAADAPGADGLRLGVEAGQHFLRLLASQQVSQDYRDAFITTFAVQALPDQELAPLDAATRGYLRLVAGRALDGRRLRAALAKLPPNTLPNIGSPIAPSDTAELREVCAAWIAWVDTLFSQPKPGEQAWQRERMEYSFSLATRTSADPFDEWTLTAEEYGGGTLDWYSFDRNGEVNVGTTAGEADEGHLITATSLPVPVSLRGMPAPRFWEMEDALLDLGAVKLDGSDLPALLMIDTITGYGNDWYVVGIDLPTGSLVTSRSLVVTDTFGVQTLLQPNGHQATTGKQGFSVFQLAMPFDGDGSSAPMTGAFLLAGALARPLEGAPIEEVLFLRDEQANVGWAVERRLTSPLEQAIDAATDSISTDSPTPTGEPSDASRYRLASTVPPHWIPLLPLRPDPNRVDIRLARAAVLDVDGSQREITSAAALLGDPNASMLIPEEEVPREGAIVRRTFQAARDADGRLHVWLTHRKSIGRGEGSSGLCFDTLTS